jgi:hypothetical protein
MEDLIQDSLVILAGDDTYLNNTESNITYPSMNHTLYSSSHEYIYCLFLLILVVPCLGVVLNWFFKENAIQQIVPYFISPENVQALEENSVVPIASMNIEIPVAIQV